MVRSGGAERVRLSPPFRQQTAHIRSVDDYLDWLEPRTPLQCDHVMRPQSWYVTDLKTGAVLVKRLFLLGAETEALAAYLRGHGIGPLGWVNRSRRQPLDLTPEQCRRVVSLYPQDFALISALRAQHAREGAARRVDQGALSVAAE
jgi:hypothetical protein